MGKFRINYSINNLLLVTKKFILITIFFVRKSYNMLHSDIVDVVFDYKFKRIIE